MTTVLFHRDYKRFTGGDLKVWDYFNHVLATPGYEALVRFSEGSSWDESNPWHAARERVIGPAEPVDADIHVLSGVDWLALDRELWPEYPVPIVNLVQHVKHACENDTLGRRRFLRHKAIRICVGPEIERAILATGMVRGPTFVIPDAVDVPALERRGRAERDLDLVVAANKQPDLGRRLAARLAHPGRAVELVDERIARDRLVDLIARARVAVLVPNPKEGFYLPAVEAMALGAVVVCPDCIGNRSFCLSGENCFRPAYDEDAIAAAAQEALARAGELGPMIEKGRATARRHDLPGERRAFQQVLARVDELWAAA